MKRTDRQTDDVIPRADVARVKLLRTKYMENCWLLMKIMSTASIYVNLDLCKGAIAIELYTIYESLLLQFNNFAGFLVIIHRTIKLDI